MWTRLAPMEYNGTFLRSFFCTFCLGELRKLGLAQKIDLKKSQIVTFCANLAKLYAHKWSPSVSVDRRRDGAKCTEIWSEKAPDLSHLGPIWPTWSQNYHPWFVLCLSRPVDRVITNLCYPHRHTPREHDSFMSRLTVTSTTWQLHVTRDSDKHHVTGHTGGVT